eukprot:CAMPEP_0116572602 /NCGR_PEP_ID=MMETSP0397-20121206/18274_1 /TAXON_ID=216820 /ORGANISM="Cyclophora tenuis, Strain ECT3854" /LENGTH=121 /DNA_ID=CAMNT_0004100963 /DNA_START=51 /DNA_END=416 /DNA_ORIENTATION=-
MTTVLRGVARDDEREVELAATRAKLEDAFVFDGPLPISLFTERPQRLQDEFSLEGTDETKWMEAAFEACGEDCEECEIPEAWRVPEDEAVDVMAFLGIRRAEPIRVSRKQDNRKQDRVDCD